jgi:quercetin dioxygenase-like cupin family protein
MSHAGKSMQLNMIQSQQQIANSRTGQRMFFRKTGRDTNGAFVEIECFNPPMGVKEPEHIHPLQESSCEVISGELNFQVNGKTRTVKAGEVITIPAGTPHYFWNGSDEEAHHVQRFSPALQIDTFFITYFALARKNKLNKKGLPNFFLISLISLKHQLEIRLVKPPWVLQKMIFTVLAPIGKLLGYKEEYR